jgi:hypothetical protein
MLTVLGASSAANALLPATGSNNLWEPRPLNTTLLVTDDFDAEDPRSWPPELFHPRPSSLLAHKQKGDPVAACEFKSKYPRDVKPEEIECVAKLISSSEARNCFRVLAATRQTVIHHSGAFWCPIAKVASSSIYNALMSFKRGSKEQKDQAKLVGNGWGVLLAEELSLQQRKNLCESPKRKVTFTITRDPFDRLASAYLEKVVLSDGHCCAMQGVKNRLKKKSGDYPSPSQFIDALLESPLSDHDVHTYPMSLACHADTEHYDVQGTLSHLDRDVTKAFGVVGLKYTPYHDNDTSRPARVETSNQTLAKFGLASDTLSLHGKERVAYLFDAASRSKVANSELYKADVAAFSEYAFGNAASSEQQPARAPAPAQAKAGQESQEDRVARRLAVEAAAREARAARVEANRAEEEKRRVERAAEREAKIATRSEERKEQARAPPTASPSTTTRSATAGL